MNNRFSHATVIVALTGAIFGLYARSLSNPLIWDDSIHIERVRAEGAASAFEPVAGNYRRPLVLLSYSAQDALGLSSPEAFHAVNIGLHALNAALVYLLAVAFGAGVHVALAGAVLFAFHPLQSAAVAYVSGRTDLLATLMTLTAIAAGLRCTGRRTSAVWAIVATVAAAAAAMAKESGLVAGPLVAAVVYYARARGARSGGSAAGGALLASLAVAPFVMPSAIGDAGSVTLVDRFADAGSALIAYARLVVWPVGLHLDRLTPVWRGWAPVGVALAVGGLLLLRAFPRRPSATRFALLALFAAYLPVAGFVPIYPALAGRWVFTPEHGLYLALATAGPLFAYTVAVLSRGLATVVPPVAARAVRLATLALVPLAATAWSGPVLARQAVLAGEESAYRATLAHSPSPRACFNLGVLLLGEQRNVEAIDVYEDCSEISPNDAEMHVQLGVAYQREGERNKAEISFAKALELSPADPLAWSNYASLEATAGDFAKARSKWERALRIEPGFAPALEGLRKLEMAERGALSDVLPGEPPLPPPS